MTSSTSVEEYRPMKTRAKTPQGILRAAARYIEEHGWVQHMAETDGGRVCLLQALNKVAPDAWAKASTSSHNNDAPGRTKEEVLAVLRG
jgi:hypothetical protein